MRAVLAVVLALSVSSYGCSGDDGRGDVTPTTDSGTPPGEDAGPVEIPLPDDVIVLTEDDEGNEIGEGTTNADGGVRFYSERHDALLAFELEEDGTEAPTAGMQVFVHLDESAHATYLAYDPDGGFMPVPIEVDLPEEDSEMTVHGSAAFEGHGFEYDPAAGDPFAFSLASLTVTQNIILINVAGTLGTLVVSTLAQDLCLRAGGSSGACQALAWAIEVLGAVAFPALRLKTLGMLTWRAFAKVAGEEIRDWLAGVVCSKLGAALVRWGFPDDDTVMEHWRLTTWKYNYIFQQLHENPPADGAAATEVQEELGRIHVVLAESGAMIRPETVDVVDDAHWDGFLTKSSFEGLKAAAATLKDEHIDLLAPDSKTARILRAEVLPDGIKSSRSAQLAGKGPLQCFVGIISGVTWGVAGSEEELGINTFVNDVLTVAEGNLDTLYADHWGGTLPDPDCLPDFYEPNESWEAASTSPVGAVGDTVIEDVNLCAGDGTGAEDDWYAFTMPFMSYDTSARVDGVSGGAGQDERICLEIWYYSEAYELAGASADRIKGPVCGTPAAGLEIPTFGVSRVTGVTWSYLYGYIYPETPSATGEVDYTFRFSL